MSTWGTGRTGGARVAMPSATIAAAAPKLTSLVAIVAKVALCITDLLSQCRDRAEIGHRMQVNLETVPLAMYRQATVRAVGRFPRHRATICWRNRRHTCQAPPSAITRFASPPAQWVRPHGTTGASRASPWPIPTAAACSSDRKSTRLNSSHTVISYAVFCLKKKKHDRSKIRLPPALGRIDALPSGEHREGDQQHKRGHRHHDDETVLDVRDTAHAVGLPTSP